MLRKSETMSALIVGALKITFGLMSKTICTYGAEKLHNGGLFDKKFRDLIINEFADIKHKLDSLSRKELRFGISSFKTGVGRLEKCFEPSEDSVDGISRPQIPNAIEKQSENQSSISGSGMPDIEQALTFAHAIGKLKTIANNRYDLAEEAFKSAARDAGKAFWNDGLDIKDRILACKVRIASEILGNLADPDLAASDCVRYLKELHEQPSIVELFNEQTNGGVKRRISSTKRRELIESIIMINISLLHFILNFANKEKNSFATFDSWPLIISDTTVYHPLYYEISTDIMRQVTPPWCISTNCLLDHNTGLSAVNSKGDLILCPNLAQSSLKKLDRQTCELQTLTEGDNAEDTQCTYLAVDEYDTVYLLTRDSQRKCYNLCVCDTNGNIDNYPVEFLKGKECKCFGITKDKRLVFCCEFENNDHLIYTSDRNGQLKNCFPVRISDKLVVKDMLCSSPNEITLVAVKSDNKSSTIRLYVYSMEGHLNGIVKLKLPSRSGSANSCTVRCDYRAPRFICLASTKVGSQWKYLEYCLTGNLERSCELNVEHLGLTMEPNLSSHPKGIVALVWQNGAVFMAHGSPGLVHATK